MAKKHRGDRSSRSSTAQRAPSAPSASTTRRSPTAAPAPASPRFSRNVLIGAGVGVAALAVAAVLLLGGVGGGGGETAAVTPAPTATSAPAGGQPPVAVALAPDIDPADAAARWDAGAILLDVREPAEWDAGHVPGAEHIPLGQLAARAGELPADATILVICRSGNRSQQGRDILRAAGFEQVTSVNGGVRGWRDAGLPYEGQII